MRSGSDTGCYVYFSLLNRLSAQAFGGRVVRAARVMHGKVSPILHHGDGLFENIPSPMEATRYHSLLVERESFPNDLRITAETAEGEIMALAHVHNPVWGVQFHPESILTVHGKTLLRNFLEALSHFSRRCPSEC